MMSSSITGTNSDDSDGSRCLDDENHVIVFLEFKQNL